MFLGEGFKKVITYIICCSTFLQDGAWARIGKKPPLCSSRSELNGSFLCRWGGKPQSFSKHFRETFAIYRFLLGFRGLEASMENIFSSKVNLLLPSLSGSWAICLSVEIILWVCKEVKMRNKPTLRCFLAIMSPTIVILSENHMEDQKIKVEDHWTLLSVFPNSCFWKTNPRKFQE